MPAVIDASATGSRLHQQCVLLVTNAGARSSLGHALATDRFHRQGARRVHHPQAPAGRLVHSLNTPRGSLLVYPEATAGISSATTLGPTVSTRWRPCFPSSWRRCWWRGVRQLVSTLTDQAGQPSGLGTDADASRA